MPASYRNQPVELNHRDPDGTKETACSEGPRRQIAVSKSTLSSFSDFLLVLSFPFIAAGVVYSRRAPHRPRLFIWTPMPWIAENPRTRLPPIEVQAILRSPPKNFLMSAEPRIAADSLDEDAIRASPSLHWSRSDGWSRVTEKIATEAPLTIEIAYERAGQEVRKLLAVTMRTPGHDEELAIGFLFSEGLITHPGEVDGGGPDGENVRGEKISTWRVRLVRPPREDLQRVSRGLLTSSACGLCGRSSLEGLPQRRVARDVNLPPLPAELIASLPEKLRGQQAVFFVTGGSHGAALCDWHGTVNLGREDVGRHNAVDKLIGAALRAGLTFGEKILVLSGRASFELIQKAAAAGIPVVVAVGAPSTLAVNLANAAGITLIGFTRDTRFNVYANADRLEIRGRSNAIVRQTRPGKAPDACNQNLNSIAIR